MSNKNIKLKLENIINELSDMSTMYTYGTTEPNKVFIAEALFEIDSQLKIIAEVVFSTKDVEMKRRFDEARNHIKRGFEIIEEL